MTGKSPAEMSERELLIDNIRAKDYENNPMGVIVDRRKLLELYDAQQEAFRKIVKVLVHGRSVANDMQEAVRIAQEQLSELPTTVGRDCTTDPEE